MMAGKVSMLRSMTGFGHGETTEDGTTITVEMRTVNHRYCDIYLRMPKGLNPFEERVRSAISSRVARGKVDVFVNMDRQQEQTQEVVLDELLAASYHDALQRLSERFGIRNDTTSGTLARFPDVLRVTHRDETDKLGDQLERTVLGCVNALAAMREREGERLGDSLRGNLSQIADSLDQIAQWAPLVVREFKERLENRIAELVDSQKLDPVRLATEVALFADKCSIDEELVRLRSHMVQFGDMLSQGSPIGKKLDFLIQEMNREVNTIGSKSSNLDITRMVVELKSEIEKMREQIQNIE